MMLKKNEEYIVEIIDNGFQGEGIAKIDGFTVFVPNVLNGEKVKIKILKVLSSHAFGKSLEILEKDGCVIYNINYEMSSNFIKNNINKICFLRKKVINRQILCN